ncbi:hypothetical protein [Campylobacter jejuni]|nr:hypothetical protein [Campylobacter jejuni]HEF3760882.1 hypothetical protein [Campylobacter jejuni]
MTKKQAKGLPRQPNIDKLLRLHKEINLITFIDSLIFFFKEKVIKD